MRDLGRLEGYVEGDDYVIRQGEVLRRIPLKDADDKLRTAIKRNSWEPLP